MPTTQYHVIQDGELLYQISGISKQVVNLGEYSIWVLNAPDANTAAVIRQDPGVILEESGDPLPGGMPPAPENGFYVWSVTGDNGEFASIVSGLVDAVSTPGSLYFYNAGTLVAIVLQPKDAALIREDCIIPF
jgi:hypothetical protein